jgi:Tfp pilus assembly protein PilV
MTCTPLHARRQPARPRRPRRGISVIEIMIAVTMLGIIMMSLGRMSVMIARRGRANDITAKRNFALAQQANKYAAMPYANIAAQPTARTRVDAGEFSYYRRLAISQPTPNQYRIVVTVMPMQDTTKKDSIVVDRSLPPGNTPLCVGCP